MNYEDLLSENDKIGNIISKIEAIDIEAIDSKIFEKKKKKKKEKIASNKTQKKGKNHETTVKNIFINSEYPFIEKEKVQKKKKILFNHIWKTL